MERWITDPFVHKVITRTTHPSEGSFRKLVEDSSEQQPAGGIHWFAAVEPVCRKNCATTHRYPSALLVAFLIFGSLASRAQVLSYSAYTDLVLFHQIAVNASGEECVPSNGFLTKFNGGGSEVFILSPQNPVAPSQSILRAVATLQEMDGSPRQREHSKPSPNQRIHSSSRSLMPAATWFMPPTSVVARAIHQVVWQWTAMAMFM
jgi:hypothetical protein